MQFRERSLVVVFMDKWLKKNTKKTEAHSKLHQYIITATLEYFFRGLLQRAYEIRICLNMSSSSLCVRT